MRNEVIFRKTFEDILMLLLVTCVLGVASVAMSDWPRTDMISQPPIPDQITYENVLETLNSLFVKPFAGLLQHITPRMHLASLSFFNT